MLRRLAPLLLTLPLWVGCAGPSKLAQKSEEKLAGGQHWRAWELATKALDREPGNPRARAAAAAAASAISRDWERRIQAMADVDSLSAAEQVLEFSTFRLRAAAYTTVAVSPEWPGRELALRRTAARTHYQRGRDDLAANRPRSAYDHFKDAERFVSGYRDAARLADRAFEKALTRVAFVPFLTPSVHGSLGREVAAAWQDEMAQCLVPPTARFTRVLTGDALERVMTVAQLNRITRADAVRLGRRAGAQRVVWGMVGPIRSDTELHLFTDVVSRRITEKGPDGSEVTRWVDVPIDVIARVRNVSVDVEYQVIATQDGSSLLQHRARPSTSARVVWTSYAPEGSVESYELVSETVRASNPQRARDVETRWKTVCGEKTTLRQVLEARLATSRSARYGRQALPRFAAGAAFVFMEDLPPAEDLALAALTGSSKALQRDLMRLDGTDDVDLGVAMQDEGP